MDIESFSILEIIGLYGKRIKDKRKGLEMASINREENAKKFIQKSKEKFGENVFDYSLMNYVNNSTKITLKCNRCGTIFDIIPSVHLSSKTGCKICNRKQSYMMISRNELLNELKDKPVRIINQQDFYYKNKEKYKFQCTKCNYIFEKSIMYVLKYKQYCPICAKRKPKYELSDLLKQAKCDILNYEIIDSFKGKFKIHKFKCKKHNYLFEMKFENFLEQEHPCEKCKSEQKINKLNQRLLDKNLTLIKYDNLLHDSEIIVMCDNCKTQFETTWFNVYQSTFGGCPKCSKQESKAEHEIIDFIKSITNNDINIIHKYRYEGNKEFDIYLPNYNLAIEYDGLKFHSFGYDYPNNFYEMKKNKFNTRNKYKWCDQNNILLLNIWENEWIDNTKQKIWKSIIKSKLNRIKNRIYARNCKVKEITNIKIIREFLKNNHLQGYNHAHINLGLYYNEELVSLMTFYRLKEKENEYKLQRFCSKINTIVIGGASRLFKYFIKKYNPNKIITFANRRWSTGNIYKKLEFNFIEITEPNYFYFKDNYILYSRLNFQKHLLKDKLENYNEDLSEIENVINNGYRIIFDSGNYKFIWNKKDV